MTETGQGSDDSVYEKLVQRDDDLIGLIAYALHKQNERDWLSDFKRQDDREPSAAELNAYLTAQKVESTVQMYRDRAKAVLDEFAEQIIERATPGLQREAISSEIRRSLAWRRQIPVGIVTAVTYSAVLVGIALVLRYAGIDVLSIFDNVGQQ